MDFKQPLESYRTCWAIAMIIVIVCTIVPARIYNWPSPSSPDWLWVLITLEFIVGIGILAKLETRRLSDKDEIKKRRVNTVALFLIVTGLLLIAYFLEKIDVGDIITILVLFGTVLVAAEYANDTKRIAEATKKQASEIQKQAKATADMAEATKSQAEATAQMAEATKVQAVTTATTATATERQAEASLKMAKEMEEQRLAARPFVIPDIDLHAPGKSHLENMKDLAQGSFPVIITNVGTASAVELELTLMTPLNYSISTRVPLLLPSANWRDKLSIGLSPPEGNYELKVLFKSVRDQSDSSFLSVVLPFRLKHSGDAYWWLILRDKLSHNFFEA